MCILGLLASTFRDVDFSPWVAFVPWLLATASVLLKKLPIISPMACASRGALPASADAAPVNDSNNVSVLYIINLFLLNACSQSLGMRLLLANFRDCPATLPPPAKRRRSRLIVRTREYHCSNNLPLFPPHGHVCPRWVRPLADMIVPFDPGGRKIKWIFLAAAPCPLPSVPDPCEYIRGLPGRRRTQRWRRQVKWVEVSFAWKASQKDAS